jgi:hypothetical protein
MVFSSGDLIAILLGSISAVRWLADIFFKKTDDSEEKINALRLDFEREKAANGEIIKTVFESLKRQERSLNNLQSQFRMLVTGGGNRRLEIRQVDEES